MPGANPAKVTPAVSCDRPGDCTQHSGRILTLLSAVGAEPVGGVGCASPSPVIYACTISPGAAGSAIVTTPWKSWCATIISRCPSIDLPVRSKAGAAGFNSNCPPLSNGLDELCSVIGKAGNCGE